MSEESLRTQIATYLARLDALMVQGRRICAMLRKDPGSAAVMAANRNWQQECGATIHQLSGGSKAHWLARSFSEAFLMRSTDGQAAEAAAPEELAQRLVGVLEQAVASLSRMGDEPASSTYRARPIRISDSFTTRNYDRLWSKRIRTAGRRSNRAALKWRCALPAASWKPS